MNVKITETGEVKELLIIDRKTGIDWVSDLIGNAGGTAYKGENTDGKFAWSDEDDAYLATQDTYDWWAEYISDTYATEEEAEQLAAELSIDYDDVMLRIREYQDNDYETHRIRAQEAMRDMREEYAA